MKLYITHCSHRILIVSCNQDVSDHAQCRKIFPLKQKSMKLRHCQKVQNSSYNLIMHDNDMTCPLLPDTASALA